MSDSRNEFNNDFSDVKWAAGKILMWLVGISVLLSLAGGAWRLLSQPGRVVQKTFDADNMIYNYEWFKKKHNVFSQYKDQIVTAGKSTTEHADALPPDKTQWSDSDKNELNRLRAVRQGLINECISVAREYNAKSEMANRSIFMRDVPQNLNSKECDQ